MAFVSGFLGASVAARAEAKVAPRVSRVTPVRMVGWEMDGECDTASLAARKIKSSAPANDSRYFKVTYCLPSESRGYTFRELQNIYQTKLVPFSSWYAEQQRIMKMGGKIFKVELAIGGVQRNIGNS